MMDPEMIPRMPDVDPLILSIISTPSTALPCIIVGTVMLLPAFVCLLRMYFSSSLRYCTSGRTLRGKVAIVTGSNTGIGKEVARDLALRGAQVIMACRNLEKGTDAAKDIISSTGNEDVWVKKCDLTSLQSVRFFCEDINFSVDRIDILVCNAGCGSPFGRNLTVDGFELQFQTNHLAHFLMVHLLLDLMKRTKGSRIVVTSSIAHRFGHIDLDNLPNQNQYVSHPFLTYCDTKLCNLLFVKELARRLNHTHVTINAVHPGTIYTNIIRNNPIWYVKWALTGVCFLYGYRTEQDGAQTIVYLAVDPEVDHVSGQYFDNCAPSSYNPLADDPDLGRRLYNISIKLSSIRFTEL